MKFTFLVVLFLATSSMAADKEPLPNFHEVVKGVLYRGGQPTPEGLEKLRELGIRTIIDLRQEHPEITAKEKNLWAEKYHLNFVPAPMTAFSKLASSKVAKIQKILNDPNMAPVFVHCSLGMDRTGLIIGLYRVDHGMDSEAAYSEMLENGFHPNLKVLKDFFSRETGCNVKLGKL